MQKNNSIQYQQRLNELLLDSLDNLDYDYIKSLLEKGADPSIGYGINLQYYPIIRACHANRLDIVKLFAEKHGNLHFQNEYLLDISISYGHFNISDYLISQGADLNKCTPSLCQYSSVKENLPILQYLKKHGFDLHQKNHLILTHALYRGDLDIVKYLMDNGSTYDSQDALIIVSTRGYLDLVKYFILEKKHDINQLLNDKTFCQSNPPGKENILQWLLSYHQANKINQHLQNALLEKDESVLPHKKLKL